MLIDGVEILNKSHLLEIISNSYISEVFGENTKIHIKLKINIREYLIISNILFPSLEKFSETN
jgi:hypothetical protein